MAIIMLGTVAAFCLIVIVLGVIYVKRSKENRSAFFNYTKHAEDA